MIFVCFPGTGKTYAAAETDDVFYLQPYVTWRHDDIPDTDAAGLSTAEIFFNRLMALTSEYRHVLIQFDFQVVTMLNEQHIPYIVLAPDVSEPSLKDEYEQRMFNKGHNTIYISTIIFHWEELLDKVSQLSKTIVLLKSGEYVSQVIRAFDRVTQLIKIKALYKGRLSMIADFHGLPCKDWEFLKNFYGNIAVLEYHGEYMCFFYSEDDYAEPFFRTSPGIYSPVDGAAIIRTRHYIYKWNVDTEFPETSFNAQRERLALSIFF